jgi:thioredoxin type arsenate reductase
MHSIALVPEFGLLRLLAHRLRWQLLLLLAHSDYRVQELTGRLKQPQNLVSYHLRRLREHDLVREHRSAADRRDVYYSLDLTRFRQVYLAAGQSLDPSLGEPAPSAAGQAAAATGRPTRVLFLCTHNSARSQIAEGLLRHLGGAEVEVFSAGTEPGSVRPEAIEAMRSRGIDISGHTSKSVQQFVGQSFDYVVTVCDQAKESCPIFPGQPEQIHWSFDDPSAVEGPAEARQAAFEQVARGLTNRINFLLIVIRRQRHEAA